MSEKREMSPKRGGGPGHGHGMPVEKAKDAKGTIKRLGKYFSIHKISLTVVIITAILSTIFAIYSPKVMGNGMQVLFEAMMEFSMKLKAGQSAALDIDFDKLGRILVWLGILYIISALFNYIQSYIMVGTTQKIVYKMRKEVDEKLTRLPLKYFDNHSTGDILSRVSNDIDNISNTLQQSAAQAITSIVTVVGIIIMMFTIDVHLTFISLIIVPISFVVIALIAKQSQKQFKKQWAVTGDLNGHVEEMYTGHKIVKVFGREQDSIEKFRKSNEELYDSSWKAQFISGIIMPIMSSLNNISYVLLCVIGARKVMNGGINFGDLTSFISYTRQLQQPIGQAANVVNVLQSAIASAERVFELLDVEEEIEENGVVDVSNIQGIVEFENVSFGYTEEKILIKNMNVSVKPGQMVAIVGPTGAGKTTLVNLLMRFYDINSGAIKIDGKNIYDMKREELRGIFGMVLQDTWLFSGSIKDNIAYGKENASDGEIYGAAHAAHVDHFVKTLTDGYNTELNEEGTNISQGQKQLLTIARAMLADPAILILDEATSSVDTRTEILIQKAMKTLMADRTSFVIAHRLSTIREADIILVMRDGDIIEQGNHEELMKQGGFYCDLYNSQFTNPFEAVS